MTSDKMIRAHLLLGCPVYLHFIFGLHVSNFTQKDHSLRQVNTAACMAYSSSSFCLFPSVPLSNLFVRLYLGRYIL